MQNKIYNRNEIIFADSVMETCMYDILFGSVAIYADYSDPEKERLLTVLKAGDTFGEMGMIENKPRSATAVALEKTQVNCIEADDFAEYFKDKPEKIHKIFANTTTRMRELTKDYVDVCGTIASYVKCKEDGEEISDDLLSKMKKIVKLGKKKK